MLNIPTPHVLIEGIERPNLKLSVQHNENEDEKYLNNSKSFSTNSEVASFNGCLVESQQPRLKNGIIYAGRQARNRGDRRFSSKAWVPCRLSITLDLTRKNARVCKKPFSTTAENGLDIVVATNAFGMGIDKADIRYIVHWTLTGTLEEYCQEIG